MCMELLLWWNEMKTQARNPNDEKHTHMHTYIGQEQPHKSCHTMNAWNVRLKRQQCFPKREKEKYVLFVIRCHKSMPKALKTRYIVWNSLCEIERQTINNVLKMFSFPSREKAG